MSRKGTVGLLVLLLGTVSLLFAQTIIENQDKPAAPNAGRVIALQQVWRITDESGQFYFQIPNQVEIAEDGTVYVADLGELLKFSADGKFIKSLCRKGQGPGEIEDWFYFRLNGSNLIIWTPQSQRFWRADTEGNYQGSIPIRSNYISDILGPISGGLLTIKTISPPPEQRTGKFLDNKYVVTLFGLDGKERKEIHTFRSRAFFAGNDRGVRFWDPNKECLGLDAKVVFGFHGRDYKIEVLEIAQGKIVRAFGRKYPKVPHAALKWETDFRSKFGAPIPEYEQDLLGLYPAGSNLWVSTSTEDKKRGRLYDIFSAEGRWLDSFYLGHGRALFTVWKDYVFVQEKNPDETIALVKYRIAEGKR
jgi:hypothetical protein